MTVDSRKSFVNDLESLDPKYRARIEAVGFFRIRVGRYRLGLAVVGGQVTLVRCLDRKEFYRRFS